MLWSLVFIEYFNFVVISTCVADWFLDKELIDNPDTAEEESKGKNKKLFYNNCTGVLRGGESAE